MPLKKVIFDPKKIQKKFNELCQEIFNYESDTFSSGNSKLTIDEATKVAELIVLDDIQARIDLETMDGEVITEQLNIVRGVEDDE